MKIIGHRGAAGLALENTLPAIKKGLSAGATIIEIDIRLTRDQQVVLCHDANLSRTYGVDLKINDHSLQELRAQCPDLPTLAQALKLLTNKTAIIELKEFIEPELLFAITDKYPSVSIRFASFKHQALRAIKAHRPLSYCYVLEHHSPFEIVNTAHSLKADGIGLNYGIINLLTLLLARRKHLDIYVYTLNKLWIGRIIKFIYRNVDICTDYPDQFKILER